MLLASRLRSFEFVVQAKYLASQVVAHMAEPLGQPPSFGELDILTDEQPAAQAVSQAKGTRVGRHRW